MPVSGRAGGLSGVAGTELPASFASLARARRVPGAQFAVYRNGRRTAAVAGEAEYGSGRPVTSDLAFPIGSIGKAFTATVAMILVADGDLELDEPVGEYVPECPAAAALTLRQLLSHTSGLESGPDGGPSMRRYISGLRLIQPPGRAFSYSNAGFVLVGRLIEEVTGMSWWAAMESVLLRPLGITPAFVIDPEAATTRPIAAGHAVGADGRTRPVTQNLTIAEAPAGAIAASAADLVTFGLAHLDIGASVLPAEAAAEMRRPEPAADAFGLADRWGLGLALFDDWAGHDGTADGTWCQLRIDPVNKVVVALTSNASTGASLWTDLVAELAGQGLTVASGALMDIPTTSVPPPDSCFGRYRNGDLDYSITAGPDGPVLAVDDDPQALITFHAGVTFSMRDILTGQSMYAGRCLVDRDSGAIDRIQINGRLAVRC